MVVGDVVTVVAARRRIERQQPQRGDTQLLQVSPAWISPGKSPMPSPLLLKKGLDVQLINEWHPCTQSSSPPRSVTGNSLFRRSMASGSAASLMNSRKQQAQDLAPGRSHGQRPPTFRAVSFAGDQVFDGSATRRRSPAPPTAPTSPSGKPINAHHGSFMTCNPAAVDTIGRLAAKPFDVPSIDRDGAGGWSQYSTYGFYGEAD